MNNYIKVSFIGDTNAPVAAMMNTIVTQYGKNSSNILYTGFGFMRSTDIDKLHYRFWIPNYSAWNMTHEDYFTYELKCIIAGSKIVFLVLSKYTSKEYIEHVRRLIHEVYPNSLLYIIKYNECIEYIKSLVCQKI